MSCYESLWLSKNICQAGSPMFLKKWYGCGIRTLSDILDTNGNFLSPDQLREKHNLVTTNFLEYLSLRHAIPYEWKCKLKSMQNTVFHLYGQVHEVGPDFRLFDIFLILLPDQS